MSPHIFLSLFLLPGILSAAQLRVATFNIGANYDSTGSVTESLNDPGTTDFDSVQAVLARIGADVVCLQEVANADVSGGTNGGTSSDVHSLAANLGLPYVHIPTNNGVFDYNLRNVVLSKYPITNVDLIGSADYMDTLGIVGGDGNRAKEISRAQIAVVVDVPGAAAPVTLITAHNKSGSAAADKFRRSVEMERMADYLDEFGLTQSDNIVILGDFNLSNSDATYTSEPSGLPGTWNRGIDIPLPVHYHTDILDYFPASYHFTLHDPRDLNNDTYTTIYNSTIDRVISTPAITVLGDEVYDSALDTNNTSGLTKVGNPPPSSSSADASDHYAVFTDLVVADATTEYTITSPSKTVTEAFSSFSGLLNPSPWSSANLAWQGSWTTGQTSAGGYAYVNSGNTAPALITGSTPSSMTATFRNGTSQTITALQISLTASQLASVANGTTDTLAATLTPTGGSPLTLTGLTFTASPTANLPHSANLTTTLTGLSIPANNSFDLTFNATKGTSSGTAPSDIFVNEIHYDNTSTDTGEFVEVVVAPGYTGDLSNVSLELYNGSDGTVYESAALDTFDNFSNPGVSNGYKIYYKNISGIQNGGSDGWAIYDGNSATVLEFLSYEGTITATDGPANGMVSSDIGVSQSGSTAAGVGALGLTSTGFQRADFSWTKFAGIAHSPSQKNDGQTFSLPSPGPSQPISFDNLVVLVPNLIDTDGDSMPDITDADDDNDGLPDTVEATLGTNRLLVDTNGNGISDANEDFDGDGQTNYAEAIITATNPLSGTSFFAARIEIHSTTPLTFALRFPTLLGRTYKVETLPCLQSPTLLGTHSGTGTDLVVPVPSSTPKGFFRVSAELTP